MVNPSILSPEKILITKCEKATNNFFVLELRFSNFFWLISTKTKLKAKFFFFGEKGGSGETLEGKEGFF